MKKLISKVMVLAAALIMTCGCGLKEQLGSIGTGENNEKDLALYEAIDHNNLEEMNEAILKGASLDEMHIKGRKVNPYLFALKENLNQAAGYLINKGSNVNYANNKGTSLLMQSAKENQMDLCKLLLEKGADIEAQDKKGMTVLEYACSSERGNWKQTEELIEFLVSQGARVTGSVLEYAVKSLEEENPYLNISYGTLGFLGKIAEQNGEKVDLDSVFYQALIGNTDQVESLINKKKLKDEKALELIFLTAAFGKASTLKILEEKGFSLEVVDKYQQTPLHVAAQHGNQETLAYLLERRKGEIEPDKEKKLPLDWAILANEYETAHFLLSHGAELKSQMFEEAAGMGVESLNFLVGYGTLDERELNYCLQEAVLCEQEEAIKWLIEKGADVNFTGDSMSMLEYACLKDRLKGVSFLVQQGADINGPDQTGRPLKTAVQYGSYELVKYLIENGADVNAVAVISDGQDKGKHYESALDVAIYAGDLEKIKLLIAGGADLEYQNEVADGNTPLLMAVMRNSTNVVKYLLEQGADTAYTNTQGETALSLAQKYNHQEQVKLLSQS